MLSKYVVSLEQTISAAINQPRRAHDLSLQGRCVELAEERIGAHLLVNTLIKPFLFLKTVYQNPQREGEEGQGRRTRSVRPIKLTLGGHNKVN